MIPLLAESAISKKSALNTMQHHEKHTLHWNSYPDHLREALKEMILFSDFADVTLVTDDKKQIRAHRNILSACSPVLKNILQSDCNNINPVIFLRGIKHSEMESIMQFIYLGEARIFYNRMSEFLQVSKDLEIKELSTHDHTNKTITNEDVDEYSAQTVIQTEAKPIIRNNAANKKISKTEGVRYACNLCEKQFTTQASLTTHIQSKHEGVKYACNQCDYQATRQDSLAKHIQYKHEGVKYDCNQWDYQATTPSNLTIHIQAKHEGVKHACNQCGKQFTMQKSLTRHIQSKHEGVKYACNQCDYTGAQKGNLTQHIESKHEGVKYTCNYCDHEANSKPALIYHAKSKHIN